MFKAKAEPVMLYCQSPAIPKQPQSRLMTFSQICTNNIVNGGVHTAKKANLTKTGFLKFLRSMRAYVVDDKEENEVTAMFLMGYEQGEDEEGEFIKKAGRKMHPKKYRYYISEQRETMVVFKRIERE